MKILIDTNIIVDVALERQAYLEESEQVLFLVEEGKFEGYVSASTFSDLYYIIRKQKGKNWTMDFLHRLITYCQIATVNDEAVRIALSANFNDFEDAVQYGTAMVNQLDAIATRNPQDFPVENPRIVSPSDLI